MATSYRAGVDDAGPGEHLQPGVTKPQGTFGRDVWVNTYLLAIVL